LPLAAVNDRDMNIRCLMKPTQKSYKVCGANLETAYWCLEEAALKLCR